MSVSFGPPPYYLPGMLFTVTMLALTSHPMLSSEMLVLNPIREEQFCSLQRNKTTS